MLQALERVYTADVFGGEEAKRTGLAKEVYPADQLLEKAHELAQKIIAYRSPVAIAFTRQMLLGILHNRIQGMLTKLIR